MHEANGNFQVGLIGGPSSGKTTMLLALEKYARQYKDRKGIWTYQGANTTSIDWLDEKLELCKTGKFLGATLVPQNLRLLLFREDGISIYIETQERPGGDYSGMDEEMLEYLSQCTGLIFLISPKPK